MNVIICCVAGVKIFSICLYLAGICATLEKYKKIKSLPITSDKLFALDWGNAELF